MRADMERQTILERIGWSFIRIRGCEYYRNKEKTIEKLITNLNELEIYPENYVEESNAKPFDLLEKVKQRANEIKNNLKDNYIHSFPSYINKTDNVVTQHISNTENIPTEKASQKNLIDIEKKYFENKINQTLSRLTFSQKNTIISKYNLSGAVQQNILATSIEETIEKALNRLGKYLKEDLDKFCSLYLSNKYTTFYSIPIETSYLKLILDILITDPKFPYEVNLEKESIIRKH